MADIRVVSMGPGSIDHMTWEAVQALYSSDVLIGSEKFIELYPEYGILVPDNLISGTLELIKANIDRKIAVLVTGDAGFFSLGKSIVKEFGRENVRVVAGVSIVQLAFAKLCEPWEDAQLISVHGRSDDFQINNGRFLILCDNRNTSENIIIKLKDLLNTYDIYVMEELGMENENIVHIRDLKDASKLSGSSVSVVAGVRRDNE